MTADFTYSVGRDGLRNLEHQPDHQRQRRLVPALLAHGYPANQFSNVNILSAINKSRYDATTVMLQRRFPRATLAGALHVRACHGVRRLDRRAWRRRGAA